MSREVRLLLVTIVVSVALLFLLARYRFPAPARTAQSVPVAPLERLAARATYEELASILTGLEPLVHRSVVVFRVAPSDGPSWNGGGTHADLPRFVPGLRIRDDVALTAPPPGARIIGIVAGEAASPPIVGEDLVRGLAAVRVPKAPAPTVSILAGPAIHESLHYVAAVEGTTGGPMVRPLFLGRASPISDPRWSTPLIAMGGSSSPEPGTFVFALDGRFVGVVVRNEGLPALVPAPALLEAAEPLARGGSVAPATIGVSVQPVSARIGRATGASQGAVVSFVAPGGPAAAALRVGDTIVDVGGREIRSTEDFEHVEAGLRVGAPARFDVIRSGTRLAVDIAPIVAATPRSRGDGSLGLTLRAGPDRGAQVTRVATGSSGAAGGLAPGDVVTHVNDAAAPTPAQIRAAWEALPAGGTLLLAVTRGEEHRVVALEKP